MLNALLYLPTALQYAFGWTKLTFYMNLLSFILMVPFVSLTAGRFGAEGAGWSWAAINALLLFGTLHFMHRRIVHNEKLRWYIQDVGLPLVASLSVLGAGRVFLVFRDNPLVSILQLLSIFLLSLLAAFSASSHVRHWIKGKWRTA